MFQIAFGVIENFAALEREGENEKRSLASGPRAPSPWIRFHVDGFRPSDDLRQIHTSELACLGL